MTWWEQAIAVGLACGAFSIVHSISQTLERIEALLKPPSRETETEKRLSEIEDHLRRIERHTFTNVKEQYRLERLHETPAS